MHVVPAPSSTRPAPAAAPSPAPSNPTPPPNTNPPRQNPAGTPGLGTAPAPAMGGFPGMPGMAGLGGMGGMGANRGPAGMGLDDMLQMHQQMMRNPEQMQAMLNSPMMDSLMNNPEVARSLMMMNPQMRELMERNPEVAHVFNDPSTFRQMVQMARNPSLLNEMLRNTDRQMANIEMMPGGFDALRRMHENIQAPLMDAAQGGFNGDNESGATADANADGNPFSSLFNTRNTPSNAPMPNPWAPNNGVPTPANAPTTNGRAAPTAGTPNAFASLFQNPPAADRNANPSADTTNNAGQGTMPQMPGLPPGVSPDNMFEMLENPMMQALMQTILSDPQMLQSMISSNPQLQAMMQTNPELGRVLQNPEVLRTMLNPEVTRSIMRFQEALTRSGMGGQFGAPPNQQPSTDAQANQPPSNANPQVGNLFGQWPNVAIPPGLNQANQNQAAPGSTPTGNGATQTSRDMNNAALPNSGQTAGGENNANMRRLEDFFAMMNATQAMANNGGMGSGSTQQMSQEQLEEMYSTQLAQLRDMGFLDKTMCLQALQQSQGNVSAAIDNLLNRFGG